MGGSIISTVSVGEEWVIPPPGSVVFLERGLGYAGGFGQRFCFTLVNQKGFESRRRLRPEVLFHLSKSEGGFVFTMEVGKVGFPFHQRKSEKGFGFRRLRPKVLFHLSKSEGV